MPKRICNFYGCKNIIPYAEKYCDEHKDEAKIQSSQRHKDYKKIRHDKKEQSFYKSKDWNVIRTIVKVRDHGLCKLCESENKIIFYQTVHHIEEVNLKWSKRLDHNNCICLCESCHQLVHKEYLVSVSAKKNMQLKLKKLINN